MMFLAPLAGLVAGGIGITVLISLHVLKLRRVPMRVSAVWIWESAARDTQANVPWQRLRLSWLLLLQLLAIILLAAAIARPAIIGTRASASKIILLIDVSASMGANDSNAVITRLQRALEQARQSVRTLRQERSNVRVAILESAASVRVVQPFTSNPRLIARALDSIVLTQESGDLPRALDMAVSMFITQGETAESQIARILCFSDGVSGIGAYRHNAAPDGVIVEHMPPPGMTDSPPVNIGITAFDVTREPGNPELLNCFAQIISTSTEPIAVPVVLEIDGVPVRAHEVFLPGAQGQTIGTAVYNEQVYAAASSIVRLRVRYNDALAADNTAQAVLPARQTARVMVVAPEAKADLFLLRALEAAGSLLVRVVDLESYEQVWAFQSDMDLIVFDRTSPKNAPNLPTLALASTSGLQGFSITPPTSTGTSRLLFWRREHPVMSGVELESVLFDDLGTLRWDINALPNSSVEVLARGVDGPSMVFVENGFIPRVLVSAPLSRTSWPLDASFVVFISNVIPILTPHLSSQGFSLTTNDTMLVQPAPGSQSIGLDGPAQARWPVRNESQRVAIGPLSQAGVYQVDGASGLEYLAVNLENERESALQAESLTPSPRVELATPSPGLESRQELWTWFLVAGLLLLMVEWLLSTSRLRA
jgi:VWA domain-containing protein/aerotolerance regulator-like protein